MKTAATTLKAAFPHTVPVLTGYLFMGIAFGILLQSKGYGFLWAGLMSVSIFAGAMQFVAVSILAAPFAPLSVFLVTLMVNARHIFYGFSMLETFRGTGRRKPYLIFGMTDETFTLLYSTPPPEGVSRSGFFLCITLLDHIYWICGGVVGALLGARLPFDTEGIDFVMTALFAAILTEQLREKRNRVPGVLGLFLSLACLLLFGPERFILPAMLVLAAALTLVRKPLERRDAE